MRRRGDEVMRRAGLVKKIVNGRKIASLRSQ